MRLLASSVSARYCSLFCSSHKANPRESQGNFKVPVKNKDLKFPIKKFASPIIAVLLAVSPICNPPDFLFRDNCYIKESLGQTLDIQRGATLFNRACIGCHDTGGNIIQPGATLFPSDLQRNGVDTEEEIYSVTYYGKGRMPGFGEKCTPRGQCTFGPRLQDEEIKLLSEFVKLQADQGWPNVSTESSE